VAVTSAAPTKAPAAKKPAPKVEPRPPKPVAAPQPQRLPLFLSPPSAGNVVEGAGGVPMAAPVQSAIEGSYGVNLGSVRVHTDTQAQNKTRSLSARAFTFGNHIFLGRGERATDLRLMAHEAAHVVQQRGAPTVQKLSSSESGDACEHEAHRASAAVASGQSFTISERTSKSKVQRLGISDALDYFADKANYIPGFRMFTIILGVNPINMRPVDRSAANILRAVIEFIPGGPLITRALDNYGVFDKVGNWVSDQIKTLGMIGSAFKQAVTDFLDSLSWRDIFHLGDVWDRAKRIFLDPIERIIDFVKGLVNGIIKFIKDAILMPLAGLASQTRGWDLLIAVLGKNPITGDPVPRTADTLIGGFMKLIGQEEIWENIKKANALSRAWAWFQGAMNGLLGFVREIPSLFIQALKDLEIEDIILLPKAFIKVGKVFLGFIGNFISWAGEQVWSLLQIIFEVVAPSVMPYLKKAMAAFRTILRNPIGFVGNLVKAAKQGFLQFSSNFLAHLKAALIGWLTGTLEGANIYIPQGFSMMEIIKFVLSVLGLTWQNIRQKLVRAIGETAVRALEVGFDLVVTLVTQGPAAAWQKIQEGISNLKEMVIDGVMSFVKDRIVTAAVTKLLSMLNPAGAFIQAIIAIYNTVMFFIERLRQIAQVAAAFIDSLSAIANGVIAAAANKVESTLGGLLTLVISFLARLVGLGKVSDAVKNIIDKIRAPIDKALDKVIDWIVEMARRAGRFIAGAARGAVQRARNWWAARKPFRAADGSSHTLIFIGEGTSAKLAFQSATTQLEDFLSSLTGTTPAQKSLIAAIRADVTRIDSLKTVPDNEAAIDAGMGRISDRLGQLIGAGRWGTQDQPLPFNYPKPNAAGYPILYFGPKTDRSVPQSDLRAASSEGVSGGVGPNRQRIINKIKVAEARDWAANSYKIERYTPTTRKALPDGGQTIGVSDAYNITTGKKFRLIPGSTEGGSKINNQLKKYGYDLGHEDTQGDHLLEMQLGGPNILENLWPLNTAMNGAGGNNTKNATLKKPDGTDIPMSEVKDTANTRAVWLFIARTL
jgi:Domain of unknown function (DUF4157)